MSDFWSNYDPNNTTRLKTFLKENRIDLAAFYAYDTSLEDSFETTQMYKKINFFWIIPKRRVLFFATLISNNVILGHLELSMLLMALSWLISVIKKGDIRVHVMVMVKIVLFQPVQYLPKMGWLRYFILFCIVMLVNLDIALQSSLKMMLTLPQYDKSIKNIYDIAASEYPIAGTKMTFMQLARTLDNRTAELLQRKWIFSKELSPREIITKTDHILLVTNIAMGYVSNRQDVVKISEVSS